MRGDLFSEFDESCLFGYLFIPLFCGTRTAKEGKEKNICPRSRYMPAITLIHLRIE